jgi:hypothetical protein
VVGGGELDGEARSNDSSGGWIIKLAVYSEHFSSAPVSVHSLMGQRSSLSGARISNIRRKRTLLPGFRRVRANQKLSLAPLA